MYLGGVWPDFSTQAHIQVDPLTSHFSYSHFAYLGVHKSHFAYSFVSLCLYNHIFSIHDQIFYTTLSTWACTWLGGCVCTAFSLSSTPFSVVTDPSHFWLTAPLRYLNPLRLRAGPPLVSLVSWTTFFPLSHPVLSIKVNQSQWKPF